MTAAPSPWRKHLRLWLPALALTLIGLALAVIYGLVFAGRAEDRVARFDRSSLELQRLETERTALEARLAKALETRRRIETFYLERLGVEAERLTEVIAEVKSLASTAGLKPSAIRYTVEAIAEHGVLQRSILFSVEGGYLELRRLINLLELTETFLTLDEITLNEGSGQGTLRITLKLSTLLASAPQVPARPEDEREGRS